MIQETVIIDGKAWTLTGADEYNPPVTTPRIEAATADGVTLDINYRYELVTCLTHAGGCTGGVAVSSSCTCAPSASVAEALLSAARGVLLRCFDAIAASEAAMALARLRRDADDDVAVRVPPGCEGCASALHGGACTCC